MQNDINCTVLQLFFHIVLFKNLLFCSNTVFGKFSSTTPAFWSCKLYNTVAQFGQRNFSMYTIWFLGKQLIQGLCVILFFLPSILYQSTLNTVPATVCHNILFLRSPTKFSYFLKDFLIFLVNFEGFSNIFGQFWETLV